MRDYQQQHKGSSSSFSQHIKLKTREFKCNLSGQKHDSSKSVMESRKHNKSVLEYSVSHEESTNDLEQE